MMYRRFPCRLFMVLALVWCVAGCTATSDVAPGSDPFVVRTEQAADHAVVDYQAVIEFDHENLQFMKEHLPAVHEVVQQIRRDFPPAQRAYSLAMQTFKQTRDPNQAPSVDDKLKLLEDLARMAREALLKMQTTKAQLQHTTGLAAPPRAGIAEAWETAGGILA